jgi:hypothetical protein
MYKFPVTQLQSSSGGPQRAHSRHQPFKVHNSQRKNAAKPGLQGSGSGPVSEEGGVRAEMAHWAGRRDVPDQAYATNAKWPEPWQPWQRGASARRQRRTPTTRQVEEDVQRLDHEAEKLEAVLRRQNDLFKSILKVCTAMFVSVRVVRVNPLPKLSDNDPPSPESD